ncbi:hypothetical protein SLA2020_500820 [Shorea laevis]
MASLLLRQRKASAFGVSGILQGNMELIRLRLEMKSQAFLSVGIKIRKYSSGQSSSNFDFTDLTCPHMWYPTARRKKCKVFLHVGPTNSGKTYHALKQLESSASGIYCGQERDEVDGARHKAVTVEMADVTSHYHCAVIDEIQMLGCKTRGFSFTRALLGIAADELHLCGDAAAVPLIQEMLKVTDNNVEVQTYERLSPLVPLEVPLGSFSNIKTGDCIVTFSRQKIYKFKKQIQDGGKHLFSVVYGSLPPETRTRQAMMFNDETTYSTRDKADCRQSWPVWTQIFGEVTCLRADDLPFLHSSLTVPSPVLEQAGLLPSFDLLYMYSCLHPNSGFYQILEHFLENAKLSENYFISNCEDILKVAALVDQLPLGLHEKYLFCLSPVDMDDEISAQGLTQFAENYAKKGIVRLQEIFTPGALRVPKTYSKMKELESIHQVLDLYIWLSFRFEDSFPDHKLASSQKATCSLLIEDFLERLGCWPKPSARKLSTRSRLNSLFSKDTYKRRALGRSEREL